MTSNAAPVNVLIIASDDDARFVVETSLHIMAGWQTLGCTTVDAALALVREQAVSAILLDGDTRGMVGGSMLRQLAKDAVAVEIPVIVASRDVRAASVEALLRLGAAGIVDKPIDPIRLPGRIHTIASTFVSDRRTTVSLSSGDARGGGVTIAQRLAALESTYARHLDDLVEDLADELAAARGGDERARARSSIVARRLAEVAKTLGREIIGEAAAVIEEHLAGGELTHWSDIEVALVRARTAPFARLPE